jgi:biopolymer transport protein TolR
MAFGGNSDGPVAYINVAPLVDVMLVLLVVFMVTAPMLQQGVEVNLPQATNAPLQGNAEQLVLSIDKDAKIYLGEGNVFSLDDVGSRVAAILETRPPEDRKIYIKADRDLEYGQIMLVMGALYQAGIRQIGLVSASPE